MSETPSDDLVKRLRALYSSHPIVMEAADALAAMFTECVRMKRLYELRPQHLAEQETQNVIDAARREKP